MTFSKCEMRSAKDEVNATSRREWQVITDRYKGENSLIKLF